MPPGKGSAKSAAGIAACGLNPNLVELAGFQQLAVGNAVKGHAACKAKVLAACKLARRRGQGQHYFSVTCWMARAMFI